MAKKVKRVEGDVWEERGKTWTIKDGVKQTVTKFTEARKSFLTPLSCPDCGKSMKSHWDTKFWKTHRTCWDCVIKVEHEIRTQGKWKEYEQAKMSANAAAFLKEVKATLKDYSNTDKTNTYVTEKGKVEKWSNPDNKVIREYIDNEIEKLEEKVKKLNERGV
jgi:predicted ribosome quality control (RQC) complex YloA/Tae2 family protein